MDVDYVRRSSCHYSWRWSTCIVLVVFPYCGLFALQSDACGYIYVKCDFLAIMQMYKSEAHIYRFI